MAFPWTEVATFATAAGAGAAWLAAGASREAVSRAHRPFVFPEWEREFGDNRVEWRVRLHNDGPGVALDVRWSVRVIHPPEEHGGPTGYDEKEQVRSNASTVIRGMRAGESSGWWEGVSEVGVEEWIVVRFTDSAGVRWEYDEPFDPDALADPTRRLRKVRPSRPRWHVSRLERIVRERPDW